MYLSVYYMILLHASQQETHWLKQGINTEHKSIAEKFTSNVLFAKS